MKVPLGVNDYVKQNKKDRQRNILQKIDAHIIAKTQIVVIVTRIPEKETDHHHRKLKNDIADD